MLRRFTSVTAAFLMLVAMTRVAEHVDRDYTSALFFGFFVLEFVLLLLGVTGTERGYFGPERHPVNRMFITFSWVALLGAVVMMVVEGPAGGSPMWLAVVGGTAMFTGGMACAVLAVSSSPWRDLLYSRRFDDSGEERGTHSGLTGEKSVSDAVTSGDESVHGVPRQKP